MEKEFNSELLIFTTQKIINQYYVNIDAEILSPDNYRDVIKHLVAATSSDMFIFMINSGGGDVATAMEISSAILNTDAYCKAIVFNAFSAASIIALSCDSILVEDCGAFFIHAPSWEMRGKPQSTEAQSQYYSKSTKRWFTKIYQGFLTEEEIDKAISGIDLWIDKDEADKRLKKWVPISQRISNKGKKK